TVWGLRTDRHPRGEQRVRTLNDSTGGESNSIDGELLVATEGAWTISHRRPELTDDAYGWSVCQSCDVYGCGRALWRAGRRSGGFQPRGQLNQCVFVQILMRLIFCDAFLDDV